MNLVLKEIIEKHRGNDIFLKLEELSSGFKSDVLLSARK